MDLGLERSMDRIGRRGAACGAAAGAACLQGPGAAAKKGMREKEVEWRNASATQAGRNTERFSKSKEKRKNLLYPSAFGGAKGGSAESRTGKQARRPASLLLSSDA